MAASLRVKRLHGALLRPPSPALLHRLKSCGFGDSAPSLDDTADTKAKNYTWPVIEMRKVKGFFLLSSRASKVHLFLAWNREGNTYTITTYISEYFVVISLSLLQKWFFASRDDHHLILKSMTAGGDMFNMHKNNYFDLYNKCKKILRILST